MNWALEELMLAKMLNQRQIKQKIILVKKPQMKKLQNPKNKMDKLDLKMEVKKLNQQMLIQSNLRMTNQLKKIK